jgi:hypothetical protein
MNGRLLGTCHVFPLQRRARRRHGSQLRRRQNLHHHVDAATVCRAETWPSGGGARHHLAGSGAGSLIAWRTRRLTCLTKSAGTARHLPGAATGRRCTCSSQFSDRAAPHTLRLVSPYATAAQVSVTPRESGRFQIFAASSPSRRHQSGAPARAVPPRTPAARSATKD